MNDAVTIRTSRKHVENPVVGYEVIERGDYVVLEIGDTGVGIEREALERVFEPFFTTRKKANRSVNRHRTGQHALRPSTPARQNLDAVA